MPRAGLARASSLPPLPFVNLLIRRDEFDETGERSGTGSVSLARRFREGTPMYRTSETTRRLGQALREAMPLTQGLPPELQALLLRLALADAERRHYAAPRTAA